MFKFLIGFLIGSIIAYNAATEDFRQKLFYDPNSYPATYSPSAGFTGNSMGVRR